MLMEEMLYDKWIASSSTSPLTLFPYHSLEVYEMDKSNSVWKTATTTVSQEFVELSILCNFEKKVPVKKVTFRSTDDEKSWR